LPQKNRKNLKSYRMLIAKLPIGLALLICII
jgi:hypothetical protein